MFDLQQEIYEYGTAYYYSLIRYTSELLFGDVDWGCVLRLNRSKKISSNGRTQLIQTAETRWEGAEEENQETAKAAIKKGRLSFVILKKKPSSAAKAKVGLKHWLKI